MSAALERYRQLTRNLALATTAITVLVEGLAQREVLRFLEAAQIPMVLASGVCLAGLYAYSREYQPTRRGAEAVRGRSPG